MLKLDGQIAPGNFLRDWSAQTIRVYLGQYAREQGGGAFFCHSRPVWERPGTGETPRS